jgi:tetratricopeptide (TPR) repeat protein
MPNLTPGDIRKRFESSNEFNELFEAFEQALEQHLDDIELYRQLFWNHTLTPSELCLFGEKLAKEMPKLAYDVYSWLGSVFEATYSLVDNHVLALEYFRKAAESRPGEIAPYAEAANCYEPDLNIPPPSVLIDFLKHGVGRVADPKILYDRLAYFYDLVGNDEMSIYFRRKLEGDPPGQSAP